MKKAVFAGSFNPFTLGHKDIVLQASTVFDKVIVGVAVQTGKNTVDLKTRCNIAKMSLKDIRNAEVMPFDGLLTDFAVIQKAEFIVKGIRNITDFEYEKNLVSVYLTQNKNLKPVYFISHNLNHISSTIVRELVKLNGDITEYADGNAMAKILTTYN